MTAKPKPKARAMVFRENALIGEDASEGEAFDELMMWSRFFFARCCLGKVPGGAPFSQPYYGDRQDRKDRPCSQCTCTEATNSQTNSKLAANKQIPNLQGTGG